ncbi:PREDICTED: epidermis-specific secreted glycoprotein EP1-like [Populus euphratica]|uniref:Epidermis-specific secreted glycoprotein EP1-like n=1 Tax=Populus euphratica TaxID=75702 RepID=A0AAJ6TAP8_POPEU|nr:PREDICTED: epidermis-specific secreted glycoprotein EP1-like [Populus euphratica]
MVLHDSKGGFVWQSFDHPTDTLLLGQSLRVEGTARLVSRASEKENSDGPYSLVLEPKRLAMYSKSPSSPRPLSSLHSDKLSESKGRVQNVTLVNYNNTLSFLRLGIDGNLRVHTIYDKASRNDGFQATFILLSRDSGWESERQLPESECQSEQK